jgi:hypothetical protein
MLLGYLLLSCVVVGCSSSGAGSPPSGSPDGGSSTGGSASPDGQANLSSNGASIAFDDIRFSTELRRIVSPAGTVDLIDPDTIAITALDGFGYAASVDEGGGLIFAVDRSTKKLEVADPTTKMVVASTSVAVAPDYVRYVPPTHEVWVTEPGAEQIEVFTLPTSGTPTPSHAAFIATKGGPEGLTIDITRQRAYVHLFSAAIVAIDINRRTIGTPWPTACSQSHGIPVFDDQRGFLFAGCAETAKVTVLDLNNNGKQLDTHTLGPGETILGYSQALHHFYLRGDGAQPVAILGVSSSGALSVLDTVTAETDGHCVAADDRNHFWVCDAAHGRLLRFADSYPATQ